jgi:hypothetical protein
MGVHSLQLAISGKSFIFCNTVSISSPMTLVRAVIWNLAWWLTEKPAYNTFKFFEGWHYLSSINYSPDIEFTSTEETQVQKGLRVYASVSPSGCYLINLWLNYFSFLFSLGILGCFYGCILKVLSLLLPVFIYVVSTYKEMALVFSKNRNILFCNVFFFKYWFLCQETMPAWARVSSHVWGSVRLQPEVVPVRRLLGLVGGCVEEMREG